MPELPTMAAVQDALLATFYVRGSLCAIDAAGVQEVIRLGALTTVHHAPAEVLGIINLRGRIVTVLDLGRKLGFPPVVPDSHSRVLILEDRGEFIGLLVDRAEEVIELKGTPLEPPPSNVPSEQSTFFRGVYRTKAGVMALVDAGRLVGERAP